MTRTDRNKQIAGLYAEGNSIEEIADILGYKKPEYVRAFLREPDDYCSHAERIDQ